MSVSAPLIDLKTQKYDRQLRLWATTGQTALEHANICLLNATSTGCEILKNLILPGVGSVTVVDNLLVQEEDMKTNFFLEPASLGQPKAKAVVELLQELNEDASVTFAIKEPSDIIHHEKSFFDPFTMVIATNLHEKDTLELANLCEKTNKALILVKSKGLVGIFRLQGPEHPVIETHPENPVDLRLGSPFDQLKKYANSFDLDKLDQTDHAHVPFIVVILKAVEKWKEENGGKEPQTYSERNDIKAIIRKDMRTSDEENYEEAISNIWRLAPSSSNLPSDVRQVFEDPACNDITPQSEHFWVVARAVREFFENEGQGQLPLPGKLPDMKSDTTNYVALQNVYREKAKEDIAAVTAHLNTILKANGIPENSISQDIVESFCKNSAHIKVVRYRSIEEERVKSPQTDKIVTWVENEDNMSYYMVYRAADLFHDNHGRWPGSRGGDSLEDVKLLRFEVEAVLESLQIPKEKIGSILQQTSMENAITNYVRFANRETANLSALIGGLAAQEAIKLITRQYIPINNTCVFNGISSTSAIFEL
ncbi:NEDD8 activating enzyme E1 subunit 1 [Phycomyces nitens]|nr:NEDD8 activating enzyme E1 subunit 1 [Phycomyces nitens]